MSESYSDLMVVNLDKDWGFHKLTSQKLIDRLFFSDLLEMYEIPKKMELYCKEISIENYRFKNFFV